jgi:transcriptional regulator with XRE-family HTH domain
MWLHRGMPTTTGTEAMPADLGNRMRYLRQRAGLPAERVALELQPRLTARVIGDWERNYRQPRLPYLRQLAALYDVPLIDLIDAEVIAR